MSRNVTFIKKEEAVRFLSQLKIYCMANKGITVGDVNEMFVASPYYFRIDDESHVDLIDDLDSRFGWTSLEKAMIYSKQNDSMADTYYIKFPPCNYIHQKVDITYDNLNPCETFDNVLRNKAINYLKEVELKRKEDMVNNPSHYTHGTMETKDKIHEALGDEGYVYWCWGQAMRYYDRANYKWNKREDLMKAAVYARWASETLEQHPEVFEK